jgi:peptide/nickel transport system substrate-binding protein
MSFHPVRFRPVALILAFVLAAAMSVSAAPDRATAQNPLIFKVGSTSPPDSLNPFLALYLSAAELFRISHDPLYTASAKDYTPEPALATEVVPNDDGTVWTVTLRDAKWSDGEPVTADDVVWTYQANIDDYENLAGFGSAFTNYESVRAIDDKTVEITTKVPVPENMVLANEMPILPQHVWEGRDPAEDPNTEFPWVGTGPYVVSDYQPDQFVKLVKNPHYWGGEPALDELHFIFFKDTDAEVQALIKGDLDFVPGMTDAQAKSLQGNADITARAGTSRRFTELAINPGAHEDGKPIGDGHPALEDVKVRQALRHAIDKQALVDKVLQGAATVGGGYIPPAFANWAWTPDEQTRVDFDLAEANRLLDEAGYARNADGIREMPGGGNPLVFRLTGHAEVATETTLAEFITEWFAELGITVKPKMVPMATLGEETGAGNYDLAFSSWSANTDPDYILSIQTCEDGSSDTFYCNEEYDAMFAAQGKEIDPAQRKQIVADMQKNLYENAPMITLFYPKSQEAYRSDRWEPLTVQPQPDGISIQQQGRHGYASIRPLGSDNGAQTSAGGNGGDESGGLSTGAIAAIVIGGIVVVGGGAALLIIRGRKAGSDDVE